MAEAANLSISKLCAWYGESQALHGMDFEVKRGEVVTLLGRNGAGKTTTLRSIMGLVKRKTGEIRFGGDEIQGRLPEQIARKGIAYCPEERGIFASLSVEENLFLPPVVAEGGMSVDDIFALFPNLTERRSSQGTKLSGGEQQMLAIARILRTGATLLLLDEPTEGIQPSIIKDIERVIRVLRDRGGMGILLVEQYFDFARDLADGFAVMDRGQIVMAGPMAGADEAAIQRLLTI